MTREEALAELKDSIKGAGYQCHIETYKMAIEALKKQLQERAKTPCDLCLLSNEVKHECDFAKQMGFSTCDKCPIDCDVRQAQYERMD